MLGLPSEIRAQSESDSSNDGYRLRQGDEVRIAVFGETDLTTQATINDEGTLIFPMVGIVKLGGKTLREANSTVEESLRKFLVRPQVSVSILDYGKRRFTILGQVNRPGTHELPENTDVNLIEAIGIAGGFTRIANPKKVTLKRKLQSGEKIYTLDARDMLRDESTKRFEVLPGDTIFVGETLF